MRVISLACAAEVVWFVHTEPFPLRRLLISDNGKILTKEVVNQAGNGGDNKQDSKIAAAVDGGDDDSDWDDWDEEEEEEVGTGGMLQTKLIPDFKKLVENFAKCRNDFQVALESLDDKHKANISCLTI